jgi:hypothetical protein
VPCRRTKIRRHLARRINAQLARLQQLNLQRLHVRGRAMLLSSRVGDRFDAICTGAADKGTWVRIFQPPLEGRLLYGFEGVDVGHRLKVQLVHTDVEKGLTISKRSNKNNKLLIMGGIT